MTWLYAKTIISSFLAMFVTFFMPAKKPVQAVLSQNPMPNPIPSPTPHQEANSPQSGHPTASQRVYKAAVACLGQQIYNRLNPSIPEEVGCAESVSFVLKKAGYPVPVEGIPGVNALIAWMLAHGFEEIAGAEVGCIITAHRPDSSDPRFAHTGIVLMHGIASNDSANGRFAENYAPGTWPLAFSTVGSKTRYFRPV